MGAEQTVKNGELIPDQKGSKWCLKCYLCCVRYSINISVIQSSINQWNLINDVKWIPQNFQVNSPFFSVSNPIKWCTVVEKITFESFFDELLNMLNKKKASGRLFYFKLVYEKSIAMSNMSCGRRKLYPFRSYLWRKKVLSAMCLYTLAYDANIQICLFFFLSFCWSMLFRKSINAVPSVHFLIILRAVGWHCYKFDTHNNRSHVSYHCIDTSISFTWRTDFGLLIAQLLASNMCCRLNAEHENENRFERIDFWRWLV